MKNRKINGKIADSTKEIVSRVDTRWKKHIFELHFTDALILILFSATICGLSPFLMGDMLELSILLLITYFSLITILFFKLRYKLKGDQTFAGLIVTMFIVAAPFVGLAVVNPELFSSIGIMDVYTSRRFSFLFFLITQTLLIYSAVLLASTSWRKRILDKNGLDRNSLLNLHKRAVVKNASSLKNTVLEEILYGVPSLRQLFIGGEYGMAVAWGWSIIDRTLEAFTETNSDREGAKKLGFYNKEFERCYQIRNSMVHDGYLPNHRDALSILKRIKALLRVLPAARGPRNHAQIPT